VVAVHQVDRPGRADGRRQECVEGVRRERRIDALGTCQASCQLARTLVGRLLQAGTGGRLLEDLLAEPLQLAGSLGGVERDECLQAGMRRAVSETYSATTALIRVELGSDTTPL
jgi:hypothetical protein